MSACGQETCGNWTGNGCICEVAGLEPVCGPCAYGTHFDCPTYEASGSCCCDLVSR